MEFRISRETTIRWPDKCVWCSDVPTNKMKTQAGWIWQKKVRVEYPLCSKHYLLLKGVQIIGWLFDLFGRWIIYGILILLILVFLMSQNVIYPIMLLMFIMAICILTVIFNPVKISVRVDFYTMKIRNDDYAREFSMLNGLSPT